MINKEQINDIEEIRMASGVLHQPDSTIDVSGNLNPYEQRTYLTCLKVARKILEVDYTGLSFEASIGEFKDLMELGGHEINVTRLRKALEKINNLQIKYNITGKTGGRHIKRYGAFVLISGFDIDMFKDKGTVAFSLPHQVHYNMIGQIKQARDEELNAQEMKYLGTFTTREIQRAMSYETTGGLKLDGWIDKWGESKFIPPIKINDLKMMLGVDGKYKGRFKDFQIRCLDVAVKEFNDKSDKHLRYRPYRTSERITGIENPRGNVVDIQFRYKLKPKNKIPMIGEISNVYGLIELFPKHVQKYKTLPKILEGSIKKYGVGFTRKQCEYVVGHSKKAYINFLKTMITDENYKEYMETLPKVEDITEDKTISADDLGKEEMTNKVGELQKLMLTKVAGSPEYLEILSEIIEISNELSKLSISEEERNNADKINVEYKNGSKCVLAKGKKKEPSKRDLLAHGQEINKIINLEDNTDKEILAAMVKCSEEEEISIDHLKKMNKKILLLTIKKYL